MADLVYDIGCNNGADTAFYLAKGFDVVAVDADPALCADLARREAAAIAAGRLRVVNVGVSDKDGELDFFQNAFSEWSSFEAQSKATTANSHRVIRVPVVPLSRLIAEHGAPYYLKIDIEGFELRAISTLSPASPLPRFLSFEVNLGWQDILAHARRLGYRRFKIVRQGQDHLPPPPNPAREGTYVPIAFTNAHSGCFGHDLLGRWLTQDEIVAAVQADLAAAETRKTRGEKPGWFDIHARRKLPEAAGG